MVVHTKAAVQTAALIDALQWPAMALTIAASWLVASGQAGRRQAGFWLFLGSNVVWVAWALYSHAPALLVLQLVLAVMNIRGELKARKLAAKSESAVP